MRPEEIRKLVGGYAAGILTAEERRALFEAALTDQDLFDELARDQALKELLEDPAARRTLMEAVENRPSGLAAWLRRPLSWALVSGMAAAVVLVAVFVRRPEAPKRVEPVLIAQREVAPPPARDAAPPTMRKPEAPPPPAPAPKPAALPEANRAVDLRQRAAPAGVIVREPEESKGKLTVAAPPTPQAAGLAASAPQAAAVESPAPPPAAREEKGAMADALQAPAASPRLSMTKSEVSLGAARAAPIPYRILRADAQDKYADAPAQTVFGAQDRVRVVFEPNQGGRLVITGSSGQTLFDTVLDGSRSVNLDVPVGETRLTGAFRSIPFVIQVLRQQ
jgi:hypothetical protein